jgi:catechol 2,3-dioxygenase-like lactoylglutathione lyase family enzyme
MPKLHHVNVGVPPELADAECEFLSQILGLRRLTPTPDSAAFGALWFEDDAGTQVHIGVDPEHRAAGLAHTAMDISGEAPEIEKRLSAAGIPFTDFTLDGVRAVNCQDPAGNRWELRG